MEERTDFFAVSAATRSAGVTSLSATSREPTTAREDDDRDHPLSPTRWGRGIIATIVAPHRDHPRSPTRQGSCPTAMGTTSRRHGDVKGSRSWPIPIALGIDPHDEHVAGSSRWGRFPITIMFAPHDEHSQSPTRWGSWIDTMILFPQRLQVRSKPHSESRSARNSIAGACCSSFPADPPSIGQ